MSAWFQSQGFTHLPTWPDPRSLRIGETEAQRKEVFAVSQNKRPPAPTPVSLSIQCHTMPGRPCHQNPGASPPHQTGLLQLQGAQLGTRMPNCTMPARAWRQHLACLLPSPSGCPCLGCHTGRPFSASLPTPCASGQKCHSGWWPHHTFHPGPQAVMS